MSNDIYDALSFFWSWKWPAEQGVITEVLVACLYRNTRNQRYRLSITYEFAIGLDGPYTGEGFWNPSILTKRRAIAARRKFHVGQAVIVRYRSDDPSINRLDRSTWRLL